MALSAGDGVDAHEHGAVAARWRGHVGSAMSVRCGLPASPCRGTPVVGFEGHHDHRDDDERCGPDHGQLTLTRPVPADDPVS